MEWRVPAAASFVEPPHRRLVPTLASVLLLPAVASQHALLMVFGN
jgi:hypothetical protein